MTDLRPNSEIAEGVHWIVDTYVNFYIIETGDELIMIDSGLNKKAKKAMKYIKNELDDRKISKIYLTHHHYDHIGGLHYLHQHFHQRNFAHPIDAEVIRGDRKSPYPRHKILWPIYAILKPFITPKHVQAIELIKEGDIVDEMTVYHLPGHTKGSVGFLKEKTLFTGDATTTLAGAGKMFAEDIQQAKYSLKKISELDFEVLLAGHGKPILEDANMRIRDEVEKLGL